MRKAAPLLILLLPGCAALGGRKPVIENRFAGYQYGTTDPHSMTIAVFTSDPVTSSTGIGLASLSDRGQAALIEQTKGKPPVTIKPSDDGKAATVTLRNSVTRHVVVAVRPVRFLAPGDRVDAVKVSLEIAAPAPPQWQISSWTQASNGQTVIDLGKLTDTSTSKATISTGIKAVKFLPDLTVGGENDQTDAREVQIKDTTDFDAAVDNEGHAWLDEMAGWRANLAHNLSMDAVATAPAANLLPNTVVSSTKLLIEDPKKKGTSKAAVPKNVRLTEGTIYAPLAYQDQPICGLATLTYRIRHISGVTQANTFSESDDVVEFQTGTAKTAFLFSPPPFKPLYVLRTNNHVVSYQMDGAAKPAALLFASIDDATAFRDWFRYSVPGHGRLGNAVIGIDVAGSLRDLSRGEATDLVPKPQNEDPRAPGTAKAFAASPASCPSPKS